MSSNAGLQLITRCVGSGFALLGDRRAFHALPGVPCSRE